MTLRPRPERTSEGVSQANITRGLLRWLPSVIVMAAIYLLSDRTGNQLGSWLPLFQEWFPGMQSFDWGHFIAYFVLAWTYFYGFGKRGLRTPVKVAVVAMCFIYGSTDEYHQLFVEGRTADWADLRNDTIGAAAAMLLASVPAVQNRYRRSVLGMS